MVYIGARPLGFEPRKPPPKGGVLPVTPRPTGCQASLASRSLPGETTSARSFSTRERRHHGLDPPIEFPGPRDGDYHTAVIVLANIASSGLGYVPLYGRT